MWKKLTCRKRRLTSSRDKNEGTCRSGEGGGVSARYVTPDLSCEKEGAGYVGHRQ